MVVKIRRLMALYIDFLIFYTIIFLPIEYISSMFSYLIIDAFLSIISIILFSLLMIYKDSLIGYESIGKKVMFLKIYKNGKRVTDKRILRDRNKCSLFYFVNYLFMIFEDNKSVGDQEYSTIVS